MAKSLRSKRQRKLRAVKREKSSKKELERLKKMLAAAKSKEEEISEIVTVTKPAKRKAPVDEDGDVAMDGEATETIDTTKPKSKISSKTLKNEHGNYPVWMNHRKIMKVKKQHKRAMQQKKKAKQKYRK